MGAGASLTADDKAELQRAYAEFEKQDGNVDDVAFLRLLERTAPGLHAKASAAETGPAAAAALKSQFEAAKRKLSAQAASSATSDLPAETAAPPPLQKLVSWAPDRATNLHRGLAADMLKSEPLRLVDITIGPIKVAALLDTGAEHCAMSAGGASRCGLQPLIDSSFGGVAGGIGTTAKHGRVHYAKVQLVGSSVVGGAGGAAAPTSVESTASATPPAAAPAAAPAEQTTTASNPLFEVAFDVMTWPPNVCFDAILGIDFLARHKALIDVCANTMRITTQPSGETVEVPLRLDG